MSTVVLFTVLFEHRIQTNQSCYVDYSARVEMRILPEPEQLNVMRVEYSVQAMAGNHADTVTRTLRYILL